MYTAYQTAQYYFILHSRFPLFHHQAGEAHRNSSQNKANKANTVTLLSFCWPCPVPVGPGRRAVGPDRLRAGMASAMTATGTTGGLEDGARTGEEHRRRPLTERTTATGMSLSLVVDNVLQPPNAVLPPLCEEACAAMGALPTCAT